NVKITDKISAYTTYISYSATNNGSYYYGQVVWNIGSLLPNTEGFVSFKVKVNENTPNGISIPNNAVISCAKSDSTVSSNYVKTMITAAKPDAKPTINHEAVKFWGTQGTSIEIKAVITDDVRVAGATLYYRKKENSETSWSSILRTNTTGNTYTWLIPTDAKTKGVEYYIEAKDNTANVATITECFISVGYPVLLVHGINANAASNWQKSECNFVEKLGEFANVFTIDLTPSNGAMDELAWQLYQKISVIRRETNAPRVDIVSYSMGGLVSRWYTRFCDRNNSVRKLIMIGTPNHGSELLAAYLVVDPVYQVAHLAESMLDPGQIFKGHTTPIKASVEMIFGGEPGKAGKQMVPGSPFLNILNRGTFGNSYMLNDILAPNIEHYTIAGTKGEGIFAILSSFLSGKDDGCVRVESVKLANVPNTEVPYTHVDMTGNEPVRNIVACILQNIPLPQYAPLLSPPLEGTPTAV
ncbi:MAG: hypothetical protein AAB110_08550, partial [Candidatus Desantisbacteria bacterium]